MIDGNTPITNDEDVIDSRDVIARLGYLADEINDYREAGEEPDPDSLKEFDALTELAAQGEDYAPDWHYGETLIRDSYFVQYAQELADDMGAIPSEYSWPTSCIDWEAAARELRMDYSAVDFDGATYWVR